MGLLFILGLCLLGIFSIATIGFIIYLVFNIKF
jgi:hypothetical protein